ncbi:tRNA lysidine(34) synthetase TilS [Marinobacterium jannaschii]|uniref:tRNA lysidine(34) synthetase TilS n=1 Tax=Marinobacterium jannaschii TaxID=64970 RepID=UPI0006872EDA|nr:tRNA lysidine(34) synthetase TilS [Marinobacterium jannaschii]
MLARFAAALAPETKIRRWVIAHSGGLDSQVLLHLAAQLLPADRLLVLHINHQLQVDAGQWQAFSDSQARLLGLSFRCIRVCPESNSEQAARNARYGAFEALLQSGDCLLLGQHADDQAETLLYRLLRGAGLHGLGAMPVRRQLGRGVLLRPLLDCSRQQLESWAQAQHLDWVDDPSNQQNDYDRNYLRHEIIPRLKQRWPGLAQQWGETATRLQHSDQLLNRYLDAELESLTGSFDELRLEAIGAFDEIRRSHLLRRWVQIRAGLLLNAEQLQQIAATVIAAREDAQPLFQLPGWRLRRFRNGLYLVPAETGLEVAETLPELEPGELPLADGILSIERGDSGLKTLDGVRLVRRKGGERCRPCGRGGSCSVKKLMQEHHVPPWLRQRWPLLMAGDEVVAVPGITVCENWQGEKGRSFVLSWRAFALSERG